VDEAGYGHGCGRRWRHEGARRVCQIREGGAPRGMGGSLMGGQAVAFHISGDMAFFFGCG
jgi:hypothetical protein